MDICLNEDKKQKSYRDWLQKEKLDYENGDNVSQNDKILCQS